ncbi:hypothetical protein [Tropicimonas isoalkanivorans]|uniref:Uncharacterized protein n=1 Tax=Tropicimonas isoalkanivorans TaxID=441112 RepID=A0A1I1ECG7_9RHOB|nr:hypothetical protein [Tropicimonas isoalkanivorans]SFB84272.1 hypothetical protein SAMN04488094_101730 [Tropicimonas isoalkanivorans]
MILTVVHQETFDFRNPGRHIILERETDHIPCPGDLIKNGGTLAGYDLYRVEQRIFRSSPKPNGDSKDFDQVLLIVSDMTEE